MENLWIFFVIIYSLLKGSRDGMKKAALKKSSSTEILFFYTLIGLVLILPFSKDAFSDFFSGEFELVEFCNNLVYTREDFIARNLSSSYAPKENDPIYDDYIKAITDVFEKRQTNGTVNYPYITRCYIGTI